MNWGLRFSDAFNEVNTHASQQAVRVGASRSPQRHGGGGEGESKPLTALEEAAETHEEGESILEMLRGSSGADRPSATASPAEAAAASVRPSATASPAEGDEALAISGFRKISLWVADAHNKAENIDLAKRRIPTKAGTACAKLAICANSEFAKT